MQEEDSRFSYPGSVEILRAEKAILSSYIYNYPEVINFSEIELVPSMFFQNDTSRAIFETLLKLDVKNGKFDPILIYESLKDNKNFSQSFLDKCARYLEELPRGAQTLNFLKSREVIKSFDNLIEEGQKGSHDYFLRSGYNILDSKIKGFKPGQFVVIASRPGIGKTTFAMNLICNNLDKVSPPFSTEKESAIGIFSLEMINEIIIEKLIAIDSKTELFILERMMEGKKIHDQHLDVFEVSKKKISEANLLFCDDVNITLGKIIGTIKF
ncbi:hypothetical protein PVNG_02370 [Plasmodium vivax North Korean]|uniref:DNA 5'-3' helicase n=1 Tax=Plasmodium vivax North Korean TaxID=1035514 RepID=A0A0J9TNA0_PLAVI|nr:hypothetical protein PVNG_02370 [Plasmodium vivax North Korean]